MFTDIFFKQYIYFTRQHFVMFQFSIQLRLMRPLIDLKTVLPISPQIIPRSYALLSIVMHFHAMYVSTHYARFSHRKNRKKKHAYSLAVWSLGTVIRGAYFWLNFFYAHRRCPLVYTVHVFQFFEMRITSKLEFILIVS